MLELDNFLDWCDTKYDSAQHCQCGKVCTNGNYCKGQQTNCYSCIQRVHNYHNSTIHYNCDKMVLYYVLKHSYRFGAEIFYALLKLNKYLCKWDDLYITSIGCGPCTELFGALSLWRSLGKQDDSFHYRGFDTDEIWHPLMTQVSSYFSMAYVTAEAQSAFTYYQVSEERVDIIVLNYMLSDMMKFNMGQYDNFLSALITLIKQKKTKFLVVNDVNLIISIGAMNRLLRFLGTEGLIFKSIKLQYPDYHPIIGQFGKIIPKQPFKMTNKKIVEKYDPFSVVNSIQTLIKFQ